ncbi:MAG: phytoene desaturase family protein [Verrucomicrobium sp.]|nr:phytoene desaturase family protein [Verrucomicrobium sp.]
MSKNVVVAGAGLGGIAAALRLACARHAVQVWEPGAVPGGKLRERREHGYRWDLGPSLLTMPHVLEELFAAAGERLEDHLALERLPGACRYFWRDGTVIDEDERFWARPEVARYLRRAKGIYDLSGEAYLSRPPAQFARALASPRGLPRLRHLPKVAARRTLAELSRKSFRDIHLRQLFDRFATYNGSSPYRTPATFSIIPYVEARFGAWYVRGGMAEIARALARLAEARGVRFCHGVAAARWGRGVLTGSDGRTARPDVLVCNQDVLAAAQTWLDGHFSAREMAALRRPELSSSAFVLTFGLPRRYSQLRHHNLFFSDDYRAEFDDLFIRRRLPEDPSLYVALTARTDPGDAPEGCDNYFVLANAPALPPGSLSPEDAAAYADRILARLESSGLPALRRMAVGLKIQAPEDFAARDGSLHGALYGWASHSLRAALLRPPLWSARRPGLYFVGGTTHPGGGIPLVLRGAGMVAARIAEEKR